MKCGKPYCSCVGQCFAESSPLSEMTAPKMPERPTAHVSHETVYGNRYSEFNDALDYGQAMYEYGRQQMREECIAAIELERLDVPKKRLHPQGRGYEMALDDVSIRIKGLP